MFTNHDRNHKTGEKYHPLPKKKQCDILSHQTDRIAEHQAAKVKMKYFVNKQGSTLAQIKVDPLTLKNYGNGQICWPPTVIGMSRFVCAADGMMRTATPSPQLSGIGLPSTSRSTLYVAG